MIGFHPSIEKAKVKTCRTNDSETGQIFETVVLRKMKCLQVMSIEDLNSVTRRYSLIKIPLIISTLLFDIELLILELFFKSD